MIFGKDTKEWESLKGIYTATEINQQPNTWKKTIKQVEEHKEEIKAFIENVTKHDDYDIILTGAGTSEFVGKMCIRDSAAGVLKFTNQWTISTYSYRNILTLEVFQQAQRVVGYFIQTDITCNG